MATDRYAPLIPTSVEAITITQTLKRPGDPPVTRTATTITTLTLSKPPPTDIGASHRSSNSAHLSPSAIGAIVGSILGFAILLILLFCCCRSSSEDHYSDSEDSSESVLDAPGPPPAEVPTTSSGRRIQVSRTADGDIQYIRPLRRKRKPPLNVVHAEPVAPIIPIEHLSWFAGRSQGYS